MHRIAAAFVITAAVLALNGGMLREAFAEQPAARLVAAPLDGVQPIQLKSTKVLSLLVILEALRQNPVSLDQPKG
jgi:hypothetical protein